MKYKYKCQGCRIRNGVITPEKKAMELTRLAAILNRRLVFFETRKIKPYETNKMAAAATSNNTAAGLSKTKTGKPV